MPAQSIIFSGPMVKAILEGRKTQTRRVIKPQPETENAPIPTCRYGQPGSQIWIRETWAIADIYDKDSGNQGQMPFELGSTTRGISIWYKAGGGKHYKASRPGRWRSPLFMPRAASRLMLEITDVRVERLHAITEAGAIAEGVYTNAEALVALGLPPETPFISPYHVDKYRIVWESINGKTFPWSSNPWVFVIEFKRVEVEV